MKYQRLGRTELNVSRVGIGAWQFGGEWGHDYSQKEVDAILDEGRARGITLIDTAECYGDHLSERFVGQGIAGDRDRWIVATKFGHRFLELFEREQCWSAEEVRKQLEDSLKALNIECIDLYQFHSGSNEAFGNQELWTILDKQKKAGKLKHLGISISMGEETALYQTERAVEVGAGSIQLIYNRLSRDPEEKVLPACRTNDLGVLTRVPLASGLLSGKYRPGQEFAASDVRSRREQQSLDEALERVEKIRSEEVPSDVPMSQWALAWCLKHPSVTCVIPGCKNPEQVRQNAAAAELDL